MSSWRRGSPSLVESASLLVRQRRIQRFPADLLRHPDFHRRGKGVRIVQGRSGDVPVMGTGIAAVGDQASAGGAGAPVDSGRGGIFAQFALQERELPLVEDGPADAGATGGSAAGDAVAQGAGDGFALDPIADLAAEAAPLGQCFILPLLCFAGNPHF